MRGGGGDAGGGGGGGRGNGGGGTIDGFLGAGGTGSRVHARLPQSAWPAEFLLVEAIDALAALMRLLPIRAGPLELLRLHWSGLRWRRGRRCRG